MEMGFELNFATLSHALELHPPGTTRTRLHAGRIQTLKSLDERITDISIAENPRFTDFYRERIECGINRLKQEIPDHQVQIIKGYSSGVILQRAGHALAIDWVDGPVPNDIPPEKLPGSLNSGFVMRPDQRERLAKNLDLLLITHFHHDHAGLGLAFEMIRAGKKVVAPNQVRDKWIRNGLDWASKIEVESPGIIHMSPSIEYRFWPGTQWMAWHDREKLLPIWGHPEHAESNVYLVRIGPVLALHAGDNRDVHFCHWAEKVFAEGWKPNLIFTPGLAPAEKPVLSLLPEAHHLPVHDYEFLHPRFNRIPQRWGVDPEKRLIEGRHLDLFWGESCLFNGECFSEILFPSG